MIIAINRLPGGGMFGLSNNNQDNQDDQVMLKNVSKLATDLNSSSSMAQPTSSATDDATDPSAQQPVVDPGFSPQSTPSTTPLSTAQPQQQSAAPAQDDTQEESASSEPPSSFSFPTPPATSGVQPDDSDVSEDVQTEEVVPSTENDQAPDNQEPTVDTQITGHSMPAMQDGEDATSPETASVDTDDTAPAEQEPAVEESLPAAPSAPQSMTEDTPQTPLSAPIDTAKLSAMKQQAMEHLDPLVGHLDQSPEETFRTTMMMIQANDNHLLLEKALEAAKQISDDKERAQALLDIINEINYFSQGSSDENPAS